MRDAFLIPADDIPEWAWDIINRDDLLLRAKCPLEAVTVLLTDAAEQLREATAWAFREQGLMPDTLRQMTACAAMSRTQ